LHQIDSPRYDLAARVPNCTKLKQRHANTIFT
ncbi:hypothetical protein LCGC14_2243820, partial [marine sediment metagenome]